MLKPLFPGYNPLCFDGYDSNVSSLKGGEIVRLAVVPYVFPQTTSSSKAAYDCYQGSANVGTTRVTVTSDLTGAGSGTYRPLFLADEGTSGYGTMLGVLIGGNFGQVVQDPGDSTTGTQLGPHSAYASGKVTCWDKPGMYAVTLDAVATTVTTASNATPGNPLYATTAGKLTLTSANAFDAASTPTIVGRFVEFSTSRSLVTTPKNIAVSGAALPLTQMVFTFRIEN